MILCGNDIIRISRVKEVIENGGEKFLKRIYTDEEIQYCESRRMCKYESYAARFAAKEAVYKAISQNEISGFEWKDIEVCKMTNGKPFVKFHGKVSEVVNEQNIESCDLSLSHDGDEAIATYVLELK